jgi:hypothetical protein
MKTEPKSINEVLDNLRGDFQRSGEPCFEDVHELRGRTYHDEITSALIASRLALVHAHVSKAFLAGKPASLDNKNLPDLLETAGSGHYLREYERTVEGTLEDSMAGAILALLELSVRLHVDIVSFINLRCKAREERELVKRRENR